MEEVTGENIKGGGDRVVDWIWRLCNMVFDSGVASEEWRSAVIIPCIRVKERGQKAAIIETLAC